MLTRDMILAADDLPREEVEIPEWGGSVYVRVLTGGERDQLERMIAKDSVSRAAIAALCLVDATGARLFTDADVEKLAQKNGGALEKIVTAALRFNAISDVGIAEGKDD